MLPLMYALRPLNEPAALLESDVKTATGSQVHGVACLQLRRLV